MGDYSEMSLRMVVALAVGGLIGLERSFHGRPAGFRTHALVCLASAALMLVSAFEELWFTSRQLERMTLDPTRMAQGIMTGIGFLGAGVIMKQGLSVRGLTTAASIWITASIGILIGVGLYMPAGLAAVLTLGTLSVFRWIENRVPAQSFARMVVHFARGEHISEDALRQLLGEHGFEVAAMSYELQEGHVEYHADVMTYKIRNMERLAEALLQTPGVAAFRLAPAGD
jgi:putative Mg2+ transporter-C (MgtC) family protein